MRGHYWALNNLMRHDAKSTALLMLQLVDIQLVEIDLKPETSHRSHHGMYTLANRA